MPNGPGATWRFRRDLYPALRTTSIRKPTKDTGEKGLAGWISSVPTEMQPPPHYPVDRLLPQGNLQRMKRLLEHKDGSREDARKRLKAIAVLPNLALEQLRVLDCNTPTHQVLVLLRHRQLRR